MSDRHPHAAFAGVYFPIAEFDPARVGDANAAYRAARDTIRKGMPRPAQRRVLSRSYGFAEAISGLEGLARARNNAWIVSLKAGTSPVSPEEIDDIPDIDFSHESTLLSVLARLDRAEALSGTDVVHLQLHWAVRLRRTVLTAPPSTLSDVLRSDPRTAVFAPTKKPMGAPMEFDSPGREIRVEPPDAPNADRAVYTDLFNTEALCAPLTWRAVIGIACLVRLAAEAEIAAELGMTRLRRCASPRCGAWFVDKRPGARLRTHCSPGCRVAAVRARADAAADE